MFRLVNLCPVVNQRIEVALISTKLKILNWTFYLHLCTFKIFKFLKIFLFFNTQTLHIKSTTHHSIAVFPKTFYPGGIRTRVRMRCPLRHAARAYYQGLLCWREQSTTLCMYIWKYICMYFKYVCTYFIHT
jgi:hypothetical protein